MLGIGQSTLTPEFLYEEHCITVEQGLVASASFPYLQRVSTYCMLKTMVIELLIEKEI